ncbi:MAG: PrsW family glutamic-type intramembrane protease [Dehalococcoidia bacterium]
MGPRRTLAIAGGHLFALLLALAGGVLGVPGAAIQELRAGGFILLPLVGAPIAEEALKPLGVYLLLARWPRLLHGRLHTAFLAACGGLSFAVIEGLVYVNVYVSDPPGWFVTYRFTVPLAMHTLASFIVGVGIGPGLLAWVRDGSPLPKSTRNLYIAAMVLHGVFNAVALALSLSGVFPDVD